MLEIDHVIMGVSNPRTAAAAFRERFGLGTIPGGLHPGGTGNWLIPLEPPQYVELLYVADREVVATGPSAGLLGHDLTTDPLLAWAVRTDDIDAVGRRLNIAPMPGSVQNPDGSHARWRVVADVSDEVTSRPFFIQYEDPKGQRPLEWRERYATARHDVAILGFSWIELGGDEAATREWLGDVSLPLRFAPGDPGLRAVAVAGPDGDIVVRPRLS